jgi:8-oxo-dGTP diphosphatase
MGIGGQQVTIVVDVANVMGSRPDGWWRDRAGAAVRLHAQIVALASSGRATLPDGRGAAEAPGPADEAGPAGRASPAFVMVLEGAAKAAAARLASADPATAGTPGTGTPGTGTPGTGTPGAAPGPPRPGEVRVVQAPGSGDDAIVAVVRELPGRRVVVTADRGLRDRCVAAGAEILGPSWLLGLLRG